MNRIWHRRSTEPLILLGLTLACLIWSGINPFDRLTWVLEVMPVLVAIPLLWTTFDRFPLTPLAYRLIFVHAVILMVGGHYTYAQVPLGFWVQNALELSRNHYDRLGHLAQGFVPAILVREILLRKTPLKPGLWLFFLVLCACQTVSVWYEFIEWWTALVSKEAAESFLGVQGDPWDTQWDMFLALMGAILAQIFLARLHDRHLRRLPPEPARK